MDAQHKSLLKSDEDRMQDVKDYIDKNYSSGLKVKTLAKLFGYSDSTFERHFLAVFHTLPEDYIRHYRLTQAMNLLTSRSVPVSQVCYEVGYSRGGFVKAFKKKFGRPPIFYNRVK